MGTRDAKLWIRELDMIAMVKNFLDKAMRYALVGEVSTSRSTHRGNVPAAPERHRTRYPTVRTGVGLCSILLDDGQ